MNVTHALLRFAALIMIAALVLPAAAVQAAPPVIVPADAGWFDTGITVTVGDTLTFVARGQALTGPLRDYPDARSGPDGQITDCTMFDGVSPCAMDSVPYGALIGKIGADGTPFLIGSGATISPAAGGTLYLAVNDNLPFYADNHGRYVVTLH